ncbi:BCD family MFS transporter [Phenylobacterium sp.]|uniref:BCD family MFS transporter n=1 Tax=Phenylobacterium sp. TaxID=1871053 RepID=UPI0025F14741|nr:BCD family MFS transporter [Phenylobacterium sp.]
MKSAPLSWLGIVRLGLVQSALGAIVALTTSTLNRVMVVEEAMPAALPAAFIAWHYVIQLSRPHWGYGSDLGHRRTPWIVGGMGVLALGCVVAADATVMMSHAPLMGSLLALLAFAMIGGGVGAAGTSLLALLATRVAPERRPAAASITWIMMIVGIVVSAGVSGALLQPFSAQRLALVASGVAGVGFLMTLLAVWKAEGEGAVTAPAVPSPAAPRPSFGQVLAEIRTDPLARRFTIFVFVSMLAYSAQELILEPFAGLLFGMTPGQSTQLSGIQHGGVLLGMILVGALGARFGDRKSLWMRRWTIAGCVGSAAALGGLAAASVVGPGWPLAPTVFVLGFANGVFAVSAIGSMMGLAGAGRESREGVRMGVWGAAQAGAFAIGGFLGAVGVGVLRDLLHQTPLAFLLVFCAEALVFLISAFLASRLEPAAARIEGRSATPQLGGAHG